MRTQHKTLAPFAVKAADTAARTFEGLASTWDLDLGGDVIHKGAFSETLGHWKANPQRVIPLIDHHRYASAFDVLGKMVDAEETDAGLSARFEVVPGDDGDRLLARIKGGYLNGLSIGYQPVGPAEIEEVSRADGVKEAVRHLRNLKLFEVSAVIWGMNPGALASATSVKSLLGELTAEQKQELRDTLDAEATAEAAARNPTLGEEEQAALARLLLKTRLRHVTARHGGIGSTIGRHPETTTTKVNP